MAKCGRCSCHGSGDAFILRSSRVTWCLRREDLGLVTFDESEFFERISRAVPDGSVEDWSHHPIMEERAIELIESLPASSRLRFYASLAHTLTVMARFTIWSTEEFSAEQARERMRSINEMMHVLTAQMSDLLDVPARGYSSRDLCEVVYGEARRCGLEYEFAANVMSPALWYALAGNQS